MGRIQPRDWLKYGSRGENTATVRDWSVKSGGASNEIVNMRLYNLQHCSANSVHVTWGRSCQVYGYCGALGSQHPALKHTLKPLFTVPSFTGICDVKS